MGYVPANAKWYLADLVVEITIEGEPGNLVHFNLTLEQVRAVFRGLRDLLVIYDELEDGAEILYEERRGMSEEQVAATIVPKDELAVFVPWTCPIPIPPGSIG